MICTLKEAENTLKTIKKKLKKELTLGLKFVKVLNVLLEEKQQKIYKKVFEKKLKNLLT